MMFHDSIMMSQVHQHRQWEMLQTMCTSSHFSCLDVIDCSCGALLTLH